MKMFSSFAVALLLMVGCVNEDLQPTVYETVNNLVDVTMTVKEGTVSINGLTLILENNSDENYIYGEAYVLEKKIASDWYQVPILLDEYGFEDIGYLLDSLTKSEWKVGWEWLYGSLDGGEYRIVKSMLDVKEAGNYETNYLAAPFTIE